MNADELRGIARALVTDGKGILAADESSGTMGTRLEQVNVESTEETRRAYRQMLITTPGMDRFISGVILYDETIRQDAADGTPFTEVLRRQGMVPGIKVDTGAKPLAGSPSEKVTEGLDGLRERLADYRELGARFAKWRAVITIADDLPSRRCIEANAHALARYAALCQEGGLVPVVEPEVVMDGGHSIERCYEVTAETLHRVFHELSEQRVEPEHMLLKPNMVLSGKDCPRQAGVEEVAEATVRCMRATVPAAVPGVVFLSGGQSDELASAHLNAINGLGPQPWELSFSYGRALIAAALETWRGDEGNVDAAQRVFAHRASCNGAARCGTYSVDMEKQPVA